MKESFVFMLSPIDYDGNSPIEVTPNHIFRKADAKETGTTKHLLSSLLPPPNGAYISYENTRMVIEEANSIQYIPVKLAQKDWRYWIITFEGNGSSIPDLEIAAALLKDELEFGFSIYGTRSELGSGENGGFGWNPLSLATFFQYEIFKPSIKLCTEDIREIGKNHTLIKSVSAEHQHIRRSLNRYSSLKSLARGSEMTVIGLFSIIESLITHKPKLTESSNSLNHQIKTKIPLLRKRFDRKIDYNNFFAPAGEDTIWEKLYAFRSEIVHGEQAIIDSKLQILKSRENVVNFLHEATKLLLLLALKEPVLLNDLKEC